MNPLADRLREEGWLASRVVSTDANQGILLHVVVGTVEAFLGGLLISPLLGVRIHNQSISGTVGVTFSGTINVTVSVAAMGVFLVGAIILLAPLIQLGRRGSARLDTAAAWPWVRPWAKKTSVAVAAVCHRRGDRHQQQARGQPK